MKMKAKVYGMYFPPPHTVISDPSNVGLIRIFGYLSGRYRGICRLVCRQWKTIIDDEIGHHLRLNEKKFGNENGALCRRIVLERLTVEHIDKFSKYITLRSPEKLVQLICTGPIDTDWFKIKLLSQCRNLRRLELCGRFLQSQELLCRLTEDTKLSQHGLTDNTPLSCLTFPQLRTLIMSFTSVDVQRYLRHVNGTGPLQSFWGSLFGTSYQAIYLLKQMIDSNVTYILNTIRSPILRTLYISVDALSLAEDPGQNPWTYIWKREPLKNFLELHRRSLRRLYLPNYFRIPADDRKSPPIYPCGLTTLELCILQRGDRRNAKHLEKLLLAQSELRELRLEKTYEGQALTEFPSLVSVISNCSGTLKFIHLTLCPPEREFLDGHVFHRCDVLQTLIIQAGYGTGRRAYFRHMAKLPLSLKELKIDMTLFLLPDEPIKFPILETLILDDVLIQSTEETRAVDTLKFLQNVLRLRRLNRLYVDTRSGDSEYESCQAINCMISDLLGDTSYESPFSFSYLKISSKHWTVEEKTHFMDSDPFLRTTPVDPFRHFKIPSVNDEIFESLDSIYIESNIFRRLLPTGFKVETTNDDNTFFDFCYSLLGMT